MSILVIQKSAIKVPRDGKPTSDRAAFEIERQSAEMIGRDLRDGTKHFEANHRLGFLSSLMHSGVGE